MRQAVAAAVSVAAGAAAAGNWAAASVEALCGESAKAVAAPDSIKIRHRIIGIICAHVATRPVVGSRLVTLAGRVLLDDPEIRAPDRVGGGHRARERQPAAAALSRQVRHPKS